MPLDRAHIVRCLLGVAAISAVAAPSRSDDEIPAKNAAELLRRQAVPAWQRLESDYSRFRATVVYTQEKRAAGESRTKLTRRYSIKQRDDWTLFEHETVGASDGRKLGDQSVACSAFGRRFVLERGNQTSAWQVGFVDQRQGAFRVEDPLDASLADWRHFFRRTYSYLENRLDDPEFSILGATRLPSGALRFRFRGVRSSDGYRDEGWIDYQPELQWVILGYDATSREGNAPGAPRYHWRLSQEFAPRSPGTVPVLRESIMEFDSPAGSVVDRYEVVSFDSKPVPEEEFRPSAYGFDNQAAPFVAADVAAPRWRRAAWLFASSLVLVIAGVALHRYLRA